MKDSRWMIGISMNSERNSRMPLGTTGRTIEQWGIYENMDFKGPWDPAYMHFLLTDESGCGIDGARIRNKRKVEKDISTVASKHVSMRVKTKPISDVQLHVPHTIVTSSVVNRDEPTPHHENVTSRWMGMSVKDKEEADGVKEKKTSLEEEKIIWKEKKMLRRMTNLQS